MAHIAHGEDPGDIGFQQKWIALESPSLGVFSVANQIGAGQEETAFVSFDEISQPVGARQGSNENKHGAGRHAFDFVGIGTHHRNFGEMRVAMRFDEAGAGPNLNVGCLFDLID